MTIKIHELPADSGKNQSRRRIGRGNGSGWGRCCGKGEKGQQSRAGGSKGGIFEGGQTPLVRRLPKFGFSNRKFRTPRAEITLAILNRFEDGATIDRAVLHEAGLIPKGAERIKIIATGELEKKLTIKVQGFSAKAREAIEARGGSCEVV